MEREPKAVVRDIDEGVVSIEAAHDLYGVILTAGGTVDVSATEKLRADMREARRRSSINAVVPRDSLRRPACANDACPMKEPARSRTIVIRERLMTTIGRAYTTGPQTTLSEMVCPACGALLDAQVTMLESGPLFDGPQPVEQRP
jgi:hypothetical protein